MAGSGVAGIKAARVSRCDRRAGGVWPYRTNQRLRRDYRGRFSTSALSPITFVTIHPSAILRLRDLDRASGYSLLVDDLKQLRGYLVD